MRPGQTAAWDEQQAFRGGAVIAPPRLSLIDRSDTLRPLQLGPLFRRGEAVYKIIVSRGVAGQTAMNPKTSSANRLGAVI